MSILKNNLNNLTIKRLEEGDLNQFKTVLDLFRDVFEEHQNDYATDEHLEALLKKPDFIVFIAIVDGEVLGGVTTYKLTKYYTNKAELYIYDIAVKTEFHNQGIGKALIYELKTYAAQNNIESVFVQAVSDEEQAVAFYKSTFGTALKVDHFTITI